MLSTLSRRHFHLLLLAMLAGGPFVPSLTLPGSAAPANDGQSPLLEFLEPTNNAVFSTLDEIPIVLRAVASNDVFLTGEVFANQSQIATVSFCCWLCPCAHPVEGQETILQIPIPWEDGRPPDRLWQGWTNVQAGTYELTAQATGENGTLVEAVPVIVTVLDRTLRIFVDTDGAVTLVIPQGSLVPGGYDLEASPDLCKWMRLGSFQPGNVASFYFDVPPEDARGKRSYRSVYVPPPVSTP
jgi:hypothetical protein